MTPHTHTHTVHEYLDASPQEIVNIAKNLLPYFTAATALLTTIATTSDQRDIKKKAPSKCSNCGEIDYTIRSCMV